MRVCKCGCGAAVRNRRAFVDKEHQLRWMVNGGAREMQALLPAEVLTRGGRQSGKLARESGRLDAMSEKGAQRSREIAAEVREKRDTSTKASEI